MIVVSRQVTFTASFQRIWRLLYDKLKSVRTVMIEKMTGKKAIFYCYKTSQDVEFI